MSAILISSLILIGIISISSVLIVLLLPTKHNKNNIEEQSNDILPETSDDTLKNNPVTTVDDTLIDTPKIRDTKKAVDDYENNNNTFSVGRYISPIDADYFKNVYVDFKDRPFFIRNNINSYNWPKYVQYRGTSREVLSIFKDEAKDGDLAYVEDESEIYIKFADEWLPYTESTYLELLRKILETRS